MKILVFVVFFYIVLVAIRIFFGLAVTKLVFTILGSALLVLGPVFGIMYLRESRKDRDRTTGRDQKKIMDYSRYEEMIRDQKEATVNLTESGVCQRCFEFKPQIELRVSRGMFLSVCDDCVQLENEYNFSKQGQVLTDKNKG